MGTFCATSRAGGGDRRRSSLACIVCRRRRYRFVVSFEIPPDADIDCLQSRPHEESFCPSRGANEKKNSTASMPSYRCESGRSEDRRNLQRSMSRWFSNQGPGIGDKNLNKVRRRCVQNSRQNTTNRVKRARAHVQLVSSEEGSLFRPPRCVSLLRSTPRRNFCAKPSVY